MADRFAELSEGNEKNKQLLNSVIVKDRDLSSESRNN